MSREDYLRKKLNEIEEQKKPIEKELHSIWRNQEKAVEEKIKRCEAGRDKFGLDELRFAAYSRCSCGAGLCYPKNIGMHGSWYCSDILLGRAIPMGQKGSKTHNDSLPFVFYEIKSEDQPSANSASTRPSK